MRIKQLKIDGIKTLAVLLCGGPGFKIYSAPNAQGFIVSKNKKNTRIAQDTPDARIVGKYVTLKYQPCNTRESIQSKFDEFLETL